MHDPMMPPALAERTTGLGAQASGYPAQVSRAALHLGTPMPEPPPMPEPVPGPVRIPEPGPAEVPEPTPDPVPEPTPDPGRAPGPVIVPEPTPGGAAPTIAIRSSKGTLSGL